MRNNQRLAAVVFAIWVPLTYGYTTFGKPDCGRWINQPDDLYKAWLTGYLSGINTVASGNSYDPLDQLSSAEQAYLWMDNYCRANPLNDVGAGAVKLYRELQSKTPKK